MANSSTGSNAELNMTREELDLEIMRGIESLSDGKAVPSEEVDVLLADFITYPNFD